MDKIDSQILWVAKQLKDFVLSHYAGRFSVDFKQNNIMQIEKEPSLPDVAVTSMTAELASFSEQSSPGDSLTFVRRQDGKFSRRQKTVLKLQKDA